MEPTKADMHEKKKQKQKTIKNYPITKRSVLKLTNQKTYPVTDYPYILLLITFS